MKDYEKEIAEAQDILAKLIDERNAYEALEEPQKLADLIHSKMCGWILEQVGPGYYYESLDKMFQPGSRLPYLDKARTILKTINYETAVKVISQL